MFSFKIRNVVCHLKLFYQVILSLCFTIDNDISQIMECCTCINQRWIRFRFQMVVGKQIEISLSILKGSNGHVDL